MPRGRSPPPILTNIMGAKYMFPPSEMCYNKLFVKYKGK